MANQLQLFYDEILDKKEVKKRLIAQYSEALRENPVYQKLLNELLTIKERKMAIESQTLTSLGKVEPELEEVKEEIKSQREAMTDAALSALVKGETVTVQDSSGIEYEPVWSVKFVKIK